MQSGIYLSTYLVEVFLVGDSERLLFAGLCQGDVMLEALLVPFLQLVLSGCRFSLFITGT